MSLKLIFGRDYCPLWQCDPLKPKINISLKYYDITKINKYCLPHRQKKIKNIDIYIDTNKLITTKTKA